jgi:hypothetical protein
MIRAVLFGLIGATIVYFAGGASIAAAPSQPAHQIAAASDRG